MTNTAPMLSFPPEIWSNIFIFSVTKDHSKTLPALMAVNHLFRSIANRTPQLWTRLFFKKPDHFINFSRAKNLLRKSGSLPLDVHILRAKCPRFIPPFTRDIICLLREQVPRLRKLELFVDGHYMADNLLTAIGQNQPAPLLEELVVVEMEYLEVEPKFLSLTNSFHPAPRLTHLQLPPFRLTANINLRLISTIRNLTLDATQFAQFDVSEVVTLLSDIPLLQSFTLNALGVHSLGVLGPFPPPTLVTMPHLHFLEVTGLCGSDLLCHLKAPFLEKVSLDGLYDPDESGWGDWEPNAEPLTASIYHLSQNSPLITQVELTSPRSTVDLSIVFSNDAFPCLEVLRLNMTNIMDDTLRLCKPGKKLQRLELYNCSTISSAGLLYFAEGCDKNFELLVGSCLDITREVVTDLSKFVKVKLISGC